MAGSEDGRPGAGVDVVVVAGGESSRMAGRDKLGAEVGGRPLLAWTLAAVAAAPVVDRIALATAADRAASLAAGGWLPAKVVAVVPGGRRRQESVAAGVAALGATGDRVVLLHDGARPLASVALFARVAEAAALHGAAIPVVPVAETLKRTQDGVVVETVDRSALAASQTPQGFRASVLAAAYARMPPDGVVTWTDEAALLEACSMAVHVVPGEAMNLKVTYPDDLARVAAHLPGGGSVNAPFVVSGAAVNVALPDVRVGMGEDAHPFGPDAPLALGGVTFADAPRLHGHSDGDAALHAVADALLGATGLGDLGRVFPAGPETPRGIASGVLLADVAARVRAAGWAPASVDLTIAASRPRLAARLDEMAGAIASILGLPVDRVAVKASTGNLLGPEGAGRAISARAVAVVVRLDAGDPR
jgi:2-C-methyl-D-erythritol 4-phosphate cytidylyltransferase/2-C-methyl-D-erythritol 2,4-cyclodiphosphate synthase